MITPLGSILVLTALLLPAVYGQNTSLTVDLGEFTLQLSVDRSI